MSPNLTSATGTRFSYLKISTAQENEPSQRPHADSESASRRCSLAYLPNPQQDELTKLCTRTSKWVVLSAKRVWKCKCTPDNRKGGSYEAHRPYSSLHRAFPGCAGSRICAAGQNRL